MPTARIGGLPESTEAAALLRSVCGYAAFGHPLKPTDLPAEAQWSTVLHLATRHQLTALLYRALGTLDPALQARFGGDLRRSYFGQAARSLATIEQGRECAEALHGRGVRFLLLKGVASLLSLYDDPACRSVSDIDILVPVEQMDAAGDALTSIGFAKLDIASSAEDEWLQVRYGDGITYRRPASLPIELHARFRGGPDAAGVASLIAEDSIPLATDTPYLRGLRRDLAFVHTATHLFGNLRHGTPFLRDVVDLLLQARHLTSQTAWPAVWESAAAGNVVEEVVAVVELLNREWDAGIPADRTPSRRLSLLDIIYRVERTGGRGQWVESMGEMLTLMRLLPSASARLRFAGGLVAPRAGFIRWRYKVPPGQPLGMHYARHTLRVMRRIASDVILRVTKGK